MASDGPPGQAGLRSPGGRVVVGRDSPRTMTSGSGSLVETLLVEIFRDVHRYAPGLGQRRATLVSGSDPRWRRLVRGGREWTLDLLERTAGKAGFAHRHFDPDEAAQRLNGILA